MKTLTDLSIAEALAGLKEGEFSCQELVSAHIDAAKDAEELNAFVTTTFQHAREKAIIADMKYSSGEAKPLEGIPIAIKDCFCTKGVKTTCCSKILENFVPHYDATVVTKLCDEAGAIMLGKAALDEFAMGSSNDTSYFGPVINPWRAHGETDARVPGGSSGGPSTLVSGRIVMASTGTDTGGSIRQPASFTGTIGVKPTYGLCSRFGLIPLASQLDTSGYLCRNTEDAALILTQIAGPDALDSTSANREGEDYSRKLHADVKKLRVGVPVELEKLLNPESKELWYKGIEALKNRGAEIVNVNLPGVEFALTCYHVICTSQAASGLSKMDGIRYGFRKTEGVETLDDLYELTRTEGFGTEVKRRIITGTALLSQEKFRGLYTSTQKAVGKLREEFQQAYQLADSIIMPTTLGPAFKLGAKLTPQEMYMNDYLTVAASMTGLPALSVPGGINKEGLPVGLQLVHNYFDEARMFAVSQVLEEELAVDTYVKKWWGKNGKK